MLCDEEALSWPDGKSKGVLAKVSDIEKTPIGSRPQTKKNI